MTYDELQTRVVNNIGNRNDATTLAIIMARTNFLIEWLACQNEWEDLQSTISANFTTSQYEYTLAALGMDTVDRVYSISMSDGTRYLPPMKSVSRLDWNRNHLPYVASTTGMPEVFCIYGGKIFFARTPDSTYALQIDAYIHPTKVVNTASVIPFAKMDGLFESLVTAFTWLSIGEKELFDKWFKLAAPMIDGFNLDSGRLLNEATPNRKSSGVGNYWADPFRRK